MTDGIVVEGLEELIGMLDKLPANARFGASVGMNRTMNEAQDAIRGSLPKNFTLRRALFIERTIYRKPGDDWASKSQLTARVRIHDSRDYLAKFEAGGVKRPREGRSLSVPIDVPRTGADIVSRRYSVPALLDSGKAYVRDGKVWLLSGRGKVKKRTLAYVFKSQVPIRPVLHFVVTGRRVIESRGLENIAGAILIEITRGLTARSGARR